MELGCYIMLTRLKSIFSSVLDGMKEQLVATIQRTFNVDVHQADKLYLDLLQCVRKKNLITIFRPAAHENAHSDDSDDTGIQSVPILSIPTAFSLTGLVQSKPDGMI